jgi:hypothetical protein
VFEDWALAVAEGPGRGALAVDDAAGDGEPRHRLEPDPVVVERIHVRSGLERALQSTDQRSSWAAVSNSMDGDRRRWEYWATGQPDACCASCAGCCQDGRRLLYPREDEKGNKVKRSTKKYVVELETFTVRPSILRLANGQVRV